MGEEKGHLSRAAPRERSGPGRGTPRRAAPCAEAGLESTQEGKTHLLPLNSPELESVINIFEWKRLGDLCARLPGGGNNVCKDAKVGKGQTASPAEVWQWVRMKGAASARRQGRALSCGNCESPRAGVACVDTCWRWGGGLTLREV